MHLDSTSLSER